MAAHTKAIEAAEEELASYYASTFSLLPDRAEADAKRQYDCLSISLTKIGATADESPVPVQPRMRQ